MKRRITISIAPESLQYIDGAARRTRRSRSRVIEALIEGAQTPLAEKELRRMASEFFQSDHGEQQERQDWMNMSLETFRSER